MKSPIDTLLDKVDFRCTRCFAKSGTCGCWVKNIKLRCPECKRSKMVYREDTDPPGTFIVECLCDKCDDGGSRPETFYFDKRGKQIMFDPHTEK